NGLDVLPVDRRDERCVQLLENSVDDLVALMLRVLDSSSLHRHVTEVVQQIHQGDRAFVDRRRELLEEVEKLALLRNNPCLQSHSPSLPVERLSPSTSLRCRIGAVRQPPSSRLTPDASSCAHICF